MSDTSNLDLFPEKKRKYETFAEEAIKLNCSSENSTFNPLTGSTSDYTKSLSSSVQDEEEHKKRKRKKTVALDHEQSSGAVFNSENLAERIVSDLPASVSANKRSSTKVLGIDKKGHNCCYYCGQYYVRISRHLLTHSLKKEIINILSKEQSEHAYYLKELKLKGNYLHNVECISKGEGNLIVMRSPKSTTSLSNFIPCCYCFGFLIKREITKHCKTCPYKPKTYEIPDPLNQGRLLLEKYSQATTFEDVNDMHEIYMRDDAKAEIKKELLDHEHSSEAVFNSENLVKCHVSKTECETPEVTASEDVNDMHAETRGDAVKSEIKNELFDHEDSSEAIFNSESFVESHLSETESETSEVCVQSKIPDIPVSVSANKRSSTKVLGIDKKGRNCCYYCGKFYVKISRHLLTHNLEKEVIHILSKEQSEHAYYLKELRLKGNYNHNLECISKGEGNLIVMRSPKYGTSASNFIPCCYCFGFLVKREICKHCKTCPYKSKTHEISDPLNQGKLLLEKFSQVTASDDVINMLSKMRDDEVKAKIKKDPLILDVGNNILCTHKLNNGKKFQYVSNRLRNLGKLLLEYDKNYGDDVSLTDILKTNHIDSIINCVKNLCVGKDRPKEAGLRIGYDLRKAADVELCRAITCSDEDRRKEVQSFLFLINREWSDRISSSLLMEIDDDKLNSNTTLPSTSNLVTMTNFINESFTDAIQSVLVSPNSTS